MTSRYGAASHLNQRNSLFSAYDNSAARSDPRSPARPNSGYGNRYATPDTSTPYNTSSPAFSAYPNGSASGPYAAAGYSEAATYRKKTPDIDFKGTHSHSMLESLESQNDEQISAFQAKIGRLKSMTMQIGDEIRSSSNLADEMNDKFSATSLRLKNTMNRMLRMAESTGVGWRVWLGFFAFVILLFWYVWLF